MPQNILITFNKNFHAWFWGVFFSSGFLKHMILSIIENSYFMKYPEMKKILIVISIVFGTISSAIAQTQETCPGETPHGWVVVSYRACAGCCSSPGLVQMPTIKRIGSLPSGTTIEICPQPIPFGWVVVSYRACAGCCGATGLVQLPTIKRIEHLPIGTTLEICPQPTPAGWTVVSTRPCAGCCGENGLVQMPTIQKIATVRDERRWR